MHTQYQENSSAGVSTSERLPEIHSTSKRFPVIHSTTSGSIASTSGEDLPTSRGCVDYSMLHMGLYPNISLSTPPPLTSAISFRIPHQMQQPHQFHHFNPPCHPLPSHHLPFFNESSEFPPQIASYKLSHFTPSHFTPSPLTPTPTSFVDFPGFRLLHTATVTVLPSHHFCVSGNNSLAPVFHLFGITGCLSSQIVLEASSYCCWAPLITSSPSCSSSSFLHPSLHTRCCPDFIYMYGDYT